MPSSSRKRKLQIVEPSADRDEFDPIEHARLRYQNQVELVRELRREWETLGYPATALGGATGKAIVAHPLALAIQAAEVRANTFLRSCLDKRAPGRPRGTPQAPDRINPRVRLVSPED